MSSGLLTNGYFPSAAGIPLDHGDMLGKKQGQPFHIAMSLERTFGTGAALQLEVLCHTAAGAQWVPVKDAATSGNGSAPRGHIVATVLGEAVRIAVAVGTSPGSGGSAPYGTLNAYPAKVRGLERKSSILG